MSFALGVLSFKEINANSLQRPEKLPLLQRLTSEGGRETVILMTTYCVDNAFSNTSNHITVMLTSNLYILKKKKTIYDILFKIKTFPTWLSLEKLIVNSSLSVLCYRCSDGYLWINNLSSHKHYTDNTRQLTVYEGPPCSSCILLWLLINTFKSMSVTLQKFV